MKSYGELLGTDEAWRFSGRVRDVTELLAELGAVAAADRPHRLLRVVYQDACHLRHAQAVHAQPREVLAAVPGLQLIEIDEPDMCCGSAGIYNLTQPTAARDLGDRKARAILRAEPDVVATANPGCALQLGAAFRRLGRGDLAVVHPVQLLGYS
jgi:glycolate oxidase iron-sulfur subunit